MAVQTNVAQLNKELKNVKGDLREMKKFLFSPTKDPDGEYKSAFVRKMLVRAQGGGHTRRFKGKSSFLKDVREK